MVLGDRADDDDRACRGLCRVAQPCIAENFGFFTI
jgi:hypothetical protein